ncbi:MAG: hypothetical protein LBG77_04615 [Dysgonamonadaceae bacterium]|jgi:hypothetical protein|nr:hypothetical protein [Dysgonamonadaceae bacterium]
MISYYTARLKFEHIIKPEKSSRQALLVEKFIVLVRENYCTQRDTAFYANRLCLTPKYLSQTIKTATGKSATN